MYLREMKNILLSFFVAILLLPTTSNAQINLSQDIAKALAAKEKKFNDALCYYYQAGFGGQPCESSCKISGRKYAGTFACENSADKEKRERALKCPNLGTPNYSRCYCDCADEPNFNYKMICAPAAGGAVGAGVASCASACGKQGLTFNKAGLPAPKASVELISTTKFNVQGAPNCEKELNVPEALMCFCDKK